MWKCFCVCMCLSMFVDVFVLLCAWQCFCVFVLLCVWQCFSARSRHPARPLQLSRKPRHYYQLPKPCSATQYNRDTNYPAIFPPGEDDVGRAVNTVAVSVVASPHMRLDLLRIPCKTLSIQYNTHWLHTTTHYYNTYMGLDPGALMCYLTQCFLPSPQQSLNIQPNSGAFQKIPPYH